MTDEEKIDRAADLAVCAFGLRYFPLAARRGCDLLDFHAALRDAAADVIRKALASKAALHSSPEKRRGRR